MSKQEINVLYLQRVISVLEMIPDYKLDMYSWFGSDGFDDDYIDRLKKKSIYSWKATPKDMHNNCGTRACAAGWATFVIPELSIGCQEPGRQFVVKYTDSNGVVLWGLHGLCYCFKISPAVAEVLFIAESYEVENMATSTAKHLVIKRIKRLIEVGEDQFLNEYAL